MKRLLLLAVLALIAAVWIAGKLMQDAGYVLFYYRGVMLETSFWVALLLLLGLALALYLGVWLLARLLGSGRAISAWTQDIHARRSAKKTTHGMIDLVEGRWAAAQKKLSQAALKSDTPLLNYLAAARAAAENGDQQGSEALLRKAQETAPNAELAVGITKAEIQLQQGHNEQALALLLRLNAAHSKHKQVHRLLQDVYLRLGDWEALGQLLPSLRKLRVAPAAELDDIERRTLLTLIARLRNDTTANGAALTQEARASALREIWTRAQSQVRHQPGVTLAYVDAVCALGREDWAEPALRDAIQENWSDKLVERYGLIGGKDVQHQLLNAESWLKKQANNAVLMLALGRLSLRNKLWGKAREYFIASIKLKKMPEACAELARLLASLGEEAGSQEQMRQGFALLSAQLPQLPLPSAQETGIARMALER